MTRKSVENDEGKSGKTTGLRRQDSGGVGLNPTKWGRRKSPC